MQSVTETCALLSRKIIAAFVVSALAGTDLSGSLSADLMLLEAILHLLQNCGSSGRDYSTVKIFAEASAA